MLFLTQFCTPACTSCSCKLPVGICGSWNCWELCLVKRCKDLSYLNLWLATGAVTSHKQKCNGQANVTRIFLLGKYAFTKVLSSLLPLSWPCNFPDNAANSCREVITKSGHLNCGIFFLLFLKLILFLDCIKAHGHTWPLPCFGQATVLRPSPELLLLCLLWIEFSRHCAICPLEFGHFGGGAVSVRQFPIEATISLPPFKYCSCNSYNVLECLNWEAAVCNAVSVKEYGSLLYRKDLVFFTCIICTKGLSHWNDWAAQQDCFCSCEVLIHFIEGFAQECLTAPQISNLKHLQLCGPIWIISFC